MKNRFGVKLARWIASLVIAAPLLAQTPSVFIDGPATGTSVFGTVTVSGWAIDNIDTPLGSAISMVVVQVDGVTLGPATMGLSRPDVCAQFPARPGCPNVGYAYPLDTTKLTNGNHTITVVATNAALMPLSGSASVQVTVGGSSVGSAGSGGSTPVGPPSGVGAPVIVIDSPTAGSPVSGQITVSGWALNNSAGVGISSVQVAVDGTVVGNAMYGYLRLDACNLYPGRPNCPYVGYSYTLKTSPYAPGSHVITVSTTDAAGNVNTGNTSATVTLLPPPAVMIDSITPGAQVSGVISVGGWAIDNTVGAGAMIATVNILLDGNYVGSANYGISRPDVCAVYPGRTGCPNVGFLYMLDTKQFPAGQHTLSAVATDNDATPDSATWTINFTIVTPPIVTIENPAANGSVFGLTTVSGWALDNDGSGTPITSVQVSVDGTYYGTANYGLSRPDICATYPGKAGCPNVGFSYSFDTSGLSAGNHTITVTAADSDVVPDNGTASVMVNVIKNPTFSLDSSTNGSIVSGVVNVLGWTVTPPGTSGTSVNVFVDGVLAGPAFYGVNRSDICSSIPGAGCPYIGYSFLLNTLSLSAGPHLLTVTVTPGGSATPFTSGSATITVAN